MSLLTLSIGVGLAVALLFSELFGLAAGGVVVPGYIALFLTQPLSLAFTLAASFITFALVRSSSSLFVLYGRRRTAMMILVGYLVGMAATLLPEQWATLGGTEGEDHVIGHIIPGLIAIWFDRQGPIITTCALAVASVVVRLILILLVGRVVAL
jgi:poly-gamma-glutamate biosynthesis protein PgsC/CapC